MKRWRRILANDAALDFSSTCVIVLAAVSLAAAHELRPAYLEVRQYETDTFDVLWKEPAQGEMKLPLHARFSENCTGLQTRTAYSTGDTYIGQRQVRCPGGLAGKTIAIDGLATFLGTEILQAQSRQRALTIRYP